MKQLRLSPSENWDTIKKNWILTLVPKFVLSLLFISILTTVLEWNKLPPLIPLWFSRPWGIDQLAPRTYIFILPVGAFIIFLLNTFLGIFFTAEYLIFTQALYLTSLLISILAFVSVIKILFLII